MQDEYTLKYMKRVLLLDKSADPLFCSFFLFFFKQSSNMCNLYTVISPTPFAIALVHPSVFLIVFILERR